MQYTDNYQFNKPTIGVDMADIRTENANWDKADAIIHGSQISLAEAYDATRTAAEPYNTGDIVMYDYIMYVCKEDGVFGAWDPTKWERTTASAHGAGGGSDVEITPTLSTGTKIADFEIDGVQGELYAPTGGGGSGGGVYIEEVLYENASGIESTDVTIALSKPFIDYDFLGIETSSSPEPTFRNMQTIPVSMIDRTGANKFGVFDTGSNGFYYSAFSVVDDTHIVVGGWASSALIKCFKIIGIKAGGNYFTPQIYSTEEREVGTWIDSRPLYKKTFEGTLLSDPQLIDLSSLDISDLVKWEVEIKGLSGGIQQIIYNVSNADSDRIAIDFYNNNFRISSSSYYISRGYTYTATLFYTKSTDTPGSGSWTPSGVPAHHYSTEEQVVGTWIDGSTVYEKTWDLGEETMYSPGWHLLSFQKGNINRIFDGLFISDAGLSFNVGLACNAATYLEILVYSGATQIKGRYIKARYTKSTT